MKKKKITQVFERAEIFDELKNFTETGYKYFLIKSVN